MKLVAYWTDMRGGYRTGRARAVSYFRMGGMPVSACHNQHHNELRQQPLRLAACFAKSRVTAPADPAPSADLVFAASVRGTIC